jgi:hypothetical protein
MSPAPKFSGRLYVATNGFPIVGCIVIRKRPDEKIRRDCARPSSWQTAFFCADSFSFPLGIPALIITALVHFVLKIEQPSGLDRSKPGFCHWFCHIGGDIRSEFANNYEKTSVAF